MDRTKMLQVLGPAAGAAAVVVLVGVLIAVNDAPPGSAKSPITSPTGEPIDTSDAGMSDPVPAVDAPEWREKGGGLKIWDVKEGTGEPCPPGVKVLCHYTGWLTDGKVFDSSRRRGQPIDFSLNEVIKGWTKGIPGMKPGGIRRLLIPAELGYGDRGTQGIPGGATLIFEVKLLKVL